KRKSPLNPAEYSQRKYQNVYGAAESTSLVPRKQINCKSPKLVSPRVSKLSVS
ncbi:hypothetical protein AVEN_117334-2-1, partial [Araneus ventricosus]